MGLLDNVLGSSSGSAVPGGNVTKPLMIALLGLLAARAMGGGTKEAPFRHVLTPQPHHPIPLPALWLVV